MRCIAAALALILPLCAFAQEAANKPPWETWDPEPVVAPEPNAFDVYQQAFEALEKLGEPDLDSDIQTLAQRVEEHRGTLVLLRAALLGECALPQATRLDQQFPYLAQFRSAARLLAARSRVMRHYGMYLEAAMDAVDGVWMAQDVATQRVLIGHLVGMAIESVALAELEACVPHLDAAETRAVLNRLRAADKDRVSIGDVIRGELTASRFAFRDQIIGGMGGVGELEELRKQVGEAWDPAKAWEAMDTYAAEVLERLESPDGRRSISDIPIEDPLLKMLTPAYDKALLRTSDNLARFRLLLLKLAVHAYRLDNAEPPAELEALVPDYLPAIPMDPFSGKPLLGLVRDGTFVVYSVGPDGEDDEANAIEGPAIANSMGDIVVLVTEPSAR